LRVKVRRWKGLGGEIQAWERKREGKTVERGIGGGTVVLGKKGGMLRRGG
jgi:hypothetical protein